jgi:hypothetical protein
MNPIIFPSDFSEKIQPLKEKIEKRMIKFSFESINEIQYNFFISN